MDDEEVGVSLLYSNDVKFSTRLVKPDPLVRLFSAKGDRGRRVARAHHEDRVSLSDAVLPRRLGKPNFHAKNIAYQ